MPGADCGCEIHDGPHWRHLDTLWAARNRQILERARQRRAAGLPTRADAWAHHLALLAFVQEEQRRLREKGAAMEREEATDGAAAGAVGQGTAAGGVLS